MSFKIHLIIVSCIIVVVYVAWQWMNARPAEIVQPAPIPVSAYVISIGHASWGLNCRAINGTYSPPPKNLTEDNVLEKVTELCNGKTECVISVNPKTLGDDPMPECHDKMLEVEYRCFSYDRPWVVRSSNNLGIRCTAPKGQ